MEVEEPTGRPLFIKELIRRVHKELIDSQKEREKSQEEPLFIVEKLVIEANFAVAESKGVKGGLDFKLITLGGQKDYSQQEIHKVTLTLSTLPYQDIGSSKPPTRFGKRQTKSPSKVTAEKEGGSARKSEGAFPEPVY